MPSIFIFSVIIAVLTLTPPTTAYLVSQRSNNPGSSYFNTTNQTSSMNPFRSGIATASTTGLPITYQYYFSAQTLSWEQGLTYCNEIGNTASLAIFQSKTQYKAAALYLATHTSAGGEFWIGGQYKNNQWIWTNGHPVDLSMSLWADNTPPTNNSRLGIKILDRLNSRWISLPQGQNRRVLCQSEA